MNRLTELANKYNTDKGTNKVADNGDSSHGYTEFYDEYYKPLIGTHPVILEIGVWKGASIKMTYEYFNGDCDIYCLDINANAATYIKELGDNVHFHLVDQSDEAQLVNFASQMKEQEVKFDIILDDGSHRVWDQMISYYCLRKLLKPNGLYILEDLHTSWTDGWHVNPQLNSTALEFFGNFKPYDKFDINRNLELFNEIKWVNVILNNANNVHCNNIANLHHNRSVTAIIKLY